LGVTKKKQSDLADLVGGKPRASEIMNRKRPLTLRMIQRINSSWKIPAASLIAPYHLEANGEGA
jgi:HTH-type transcriptional regulator/antitoxin HigA